MSSYGASLGATVCSSTYLSFGFLHVLLINEAGRLSQRATGGRSAWVGDKIALQGH